MKHYTVVAAVIQKGNKILCMQRKGSKYDYIAHKYEFPGGKIEEGESEEEALLREIAEELVMQVSIQEKLLIVDHQYPDFKITMHTFLCQTENESPQLKEHVAFQWLERDALEGLDWAAADMPIVQKLRSVGHA